MPPSQGPSYAVSAATGALKGFAAHALRLPVGLLIAAFLSRRLGPEDYGLLTVATAIVVWIELSIALLFSRTTTKFVAETDAWRAVASGLLQAQMLISLAAAGLLIAAAPLLGAWLRSPELGAYLRLFAIDIPIFSLGRIHLAIATGRGAFGLRAWLIACRPAAQLVLILILVGGGLSIRGAILAVIGASIVKLAVARVFVRPALWGRFPLPLRRLGGFALPVFLYSAGMQLFQPLGLMVVKALDPLPGSAGFYAAAQNLMIPPFLLAAALAPVLLSTLTSLSRSGRREEAGRMMAQAMRLVICLLPFAGVVAGSASDIVILIYGRPFVPAGPPLALLIFASLGLTLNSANGAALMAAERPGLIFALTAPLTPVALGAYLWLVPRFGMAGAAGATLALAWLTAGVTSLAVFRIWSTGPGPATLLRSLAATAIAYALSSAWSASGPWLALELVVTGAAAVLALRLLGELTGRDLAFFRSLLPGRTGPVPADG